MKSVKVLALIGVFISIGLLSGCASTKVERTDISKQVDLSGKWNDSDSKLTADEMINDCLSRPWLATFSALNNNAQPVVIVGTVKNRTQEHIDSALFVANLEKSLINSGRVKFVASRDERGEIREEKIDQAENSNDATMKPQKQETGADFMLQGTINSIKDEVKGKYVILYQVNLEMVNITTNEKVWIGQKEIKKIVSRSSLGL